MKCILINDLDFVKKNLLKKIILFYVILVGSFLIESLTIGFNIEIDNFYQIIGMDSVNIFYLFNSIFYFYLTILLFSKDLKNGIENIFLRIKPKKWIIYKIISISIIQLLIILTIYILFSIILIIFNLNIIDIWKYFINNIIFIYMLQLFILLIYILVKWNKLLIIPILVLMIINIKYIFFNVMTLNFIYLISIDIIFLIGVIYLFKNKYFKVFEN